MNNLFRKEVYRRRAERLDGEVCIPRPPAFVWLAILILVIVISCAVALSMGSYARKETVRGLVEPEGGVVRVLAGKEGIISKIFVSEGAKVEAGQPLGRLRDDKFLSSLGTLGESLRTGLVQRLERLDRLVANEVLHHQSYLKSLEGRANSTRDKLEEVEAQIDVISERISINREMLERLQELAREGHASDLEVSQSRDSLLALIQEHHNALSMRVNLEEQQKELRGEKERAPTEHQQEMDRLRDQRQELRSELMRIQYQREAEIRAPVNGQITGLTATEGARVGPGDTLARILPEGGYMQAVLYLPSRSIGIVEVGQDVQIRFEAFPYERFGVHAGKIKTVEKTAILPGELPRVAAAQQGPEGRQPVYRVIATLERQRIPGYGEDFPLRPGMELEADIVLEQRTLIQWLFNPIYSIAMRL